MRVLDIFSGLGGWAAPFKERGHEVVTVDIEERFGCTYTADILTWEPESSFDIVLASPPCEAFSVLTIGKNWAPGRVPKTDKARLAIRLVERTWELIEQIAPAYFVIENPRAMLRTLPPLADLERRTVTYCQYGEPFMKPTDLWGGFPPSLVLKPMCRPFASCHISSPRGSTTGIQGDGVAKIRQKDGTRVTIGKPRKATRRGSLGNVKRQAREHFGTSDQATLAAHRAKIPHALALAVCEAAEHDLAAGLPSARLQSVLWEVS